MPVPAAKIRVFSFFDLSRYAIYRTEAFRKPMSVLAIPAISAPTYKERSSAAWLFVLVDAVALELSLLIGVLVRQSLPFYPAAISPSQYKGVAFGLLTIPLAYYLVVLYP